MTMEEFEKDPLGEKQRLKNIANLNNDLKSARYANELNRNRTKLLAIDTGLKPEDDEEVSLIASTEKK